MINHSITRYERYFFFFFLTTLGTCFKSKVYILQVSLANISIFSPTDTNNSGRPWINGLLLISVKMGIDIDIRGTEYRQAMDCDELSLYYRTDPSPSIIREWLPRPAQRVSEFGAPERAVEFQIEGNQSQKGEKFQGRGFFVSGKIRLIYTLFEITPVRERESSGGGQGAVLK